MACLYFRLQPIIIIIGGVKTACLVAGFNRRWLVWCLGFLPGFLRLDEVPIPHLHVTAPLPLGLLPVMLLFRLLTVMMKFLFCASHAVLLFCYCDAVVPLQLPSVSGPSSSTPLLLFALNLPHRLVAAADALPGMVYTDLLLFFLLLLLLLAALIFGCGYPFRDLFSWALCNAIIFVIIESLLLRVVPQRK
jgi:hypothetical protein